MEIHTRMILSFCRNFNRFKNITKIFVKEEKTSWENLIIFRINISKVQKSSSNFYKFKNLANLKILGFKNPRIQSSAK